MNGKNSVISSRVEALYRDYGKRAKELKDEGKTLIGYVCSFVPVEMISAAGCIPFRIRGDINEPVTKGDTVLETIVCPFIRSCFDLALKGKYDFLSGIVIPHGCDSMTRSYSTWSYSLDLPYAYFLNIPSVVKPASFEFFAEEIKTYKKTLEAFIGHEITEADISQAIKLHNAYRNKIRTIYDFRKSDPPMVSGVEISKILTVGTSLPVEEANALLDEIIEELKTRSEPPLKTGKRILVDGACVDHAGLVKLIEESGASVVAETTCNGMRDTFPLTDEQEDPFTGLARRYLDKINCPKTYRENRAGSFEGNIADRFGDIGRYAEHFHADGAILYVYKYCDPFGFEVPARKAYYNAIDLPLLWIEDLYSSGTMGQIKTRIQAFLEMIEQ
ncbi:2-hydroxyglutaryl-CoA dehydratase, D-component [delta proteobacterium NaphS2]|nr:2-hydroxyglutaryl-CoA dehydratase, D-component [delta proteobacterium NaphS2]